MQEKGSIIDFFIRQRIWRHIAFWVLGVSFYTFLSAFIKDDLLPGFIGAVILLPVKIAAAYFVAYYFIPKLLFKRKYLLAAVLFVVTFYMFTVTARILVVYGIEPLFKEPGFEQESILEICTDLISLIKRYFWTVYYSAALLVILKFIKSHFEEKQQLEILEKEKAAAELNFLKAQIHPHFLFNTLNNLYILTLQKSDQAPEMLLKLSEMLDYMLYQCSGGQVALGKELELLDNYIELEKLRYGDRLDLNFDQDIDDREVQIAPLLLLSLVENAFKHGASGAIGKPVIRMALSVKASQLTFDVFNSKPAQDQADDTGFKKGIGTSNVKRQLDLTYQSAYTLVSVDEVDSYRITLDIDLNKFRQ